MLTTEIKKAVCDLISNQTAKTSQTYRTEAIGGGSISRAYRMEMNTGTYFMKVNDAVRYPMLFETEQKGLSLLKSSNGPSVPVVTGTGTADGKSFIVMEFLEAGKRSVHFEETLGRKLAALHRNTSEAFGLDHDNYIGSLHQSNTRHTNGAVFFAEERIMPMATMAMKAGWIPLHEEITFRSLCKNVSSLLPDEPPALLHGDLWNGNVVCGPDGEAWLVDPSVYYGLRESDIAMTKLFGGFGEAFYESYNELFPLTKGWHERTELVNLYPLLVHVNLFGKSYVPAVMEILKRYS